MRTFLDKILAPFRSLGCVIAGLWAREPVLILTGIGIAVQAGLDAATEGATAATIWKAVLYALVGFVARSSVFSPDSVEHIFETDD